MTQKQINKLEMMLSTNEYLDTHASTWNVIPIITNYKNQLAQVIDDIRIAAEDQQSAQVFIGSSVLQMKTQIAERMDVLDDALEAYAEDNELAELLAQAQNSKSDYLRLPYEEFETKVKNMIALLETHVEDMSDYGLNQGQVDDTKLLFGTFQEKRGKPRSFQIASRIATQNISDLFKSGSSMITKLDRVMKRFRRSNANFFNGYSAARMVVNN